MEGHNWLICCFMFQRLFKKTANTPSYACTSESSLLLLVFALTTSVTFFHSAVFVRFGILELKAPNETGLIFSASLMCHSVSHSEKNALPLCCVF